MWIIWLTGDFVISIDCREVLAQAQDAMVVWCEGIAFILIWPHGSGMVHRVLLYRPNKEYRFSLKGNFAALYEGKISRS